MIYPPAEDSYLLAEQVKIFSNGKSFLDMGSGSGIQSKIALDNNAKSVLAVDINKDAVNHLNSLNIPSIQSDLFSNIPKESKFEVIAFNPPYLPEDKQEDKESALTTTGGKKGDEIILNFLKDAPQYLNKNGIILLLLSSLTPQNKIIKLIKSLSLNYQKLSSKKVFMEALEVWKIEKKD